MNPCSSINNSYGSLGTPMGNPGLTIVQMKVILLPSAEHKINVEEC